MRLLCRCLLCIVLSLSKHVTRPGSLESECLNINPSDYYGIIGSQWYDKRGIVTRTFKVKGVVLAGAYDLYGRGRVSNFLRSFNLLNMYLDIDGQRVGGKGISNMKQELDLRHAGFTTSFDYGDKATVYYAYYSLRHLPFTVLMDISDHCQKNITLGAASVMEAPDALKECSELLQRNRPAACGGQSAYLHGPKSYG